MNEMMQNLFELQSLVFDATIRPETEARIAHLRAEISRTVLNHYDHFCIRGKKGVALLRNQTCTGCHMRVPLTVVLDLKHGVDFRLCDNCQRYLYLQADAVTVSGSASERIVAKRGPKQPAQFCQAV